MATAAQIDASTKQIIVEEMSRRNAAVRKIAEKLWVDTRLSHYTPEGYIQHHECCRNMRHYFPVNGIPKSTWAILPTPDHPSRPARDKGITDGCPACDVRIWDDCLKKAQVMTSQSAAQVAE